MFNPIATYRLQFHKEFNLQDFEKIVPYLKNLGVSTIYASPIFQSVAGSTHGYDTLDPLVINKEIGTEEVLARLSKDLSKLEIGWLQDIVPNHMAFSTANPWLNDVLEKGKHSAYAEFFDIDWDSTTNRGKVMVPFLGGSLENAINEGDLKLAISDSKLILKYHDAIYPLNHSAYGAVLKDVQSDKFSRIYYEAKTISKEREDYSVLFDKLKKSFAQSLTNDNKETLEKNLAVINADKETLSNIAQQQYYVLCHWQQTDTQINYRRFFTVNGLISLNMQSENVFNHFHSFINKLIDGGIFQGLRVDHVDGLFDPTEYLQRLRNLAGEDVYITVEKILQSEETLPGSWNIEGNTGYDFLAMVNNLLTNKNKHSQLTAFYQNLTSSNAAFTDQIKEKKRKILYSHMLGDLENLYQLFLSLNLLSEDKLKTVPAADLKKAIGEFLVYIPVYRYYANKFPLHEEEGKSVQNVLNEIRKSTPEFSAAIEILSSVFLNVSGKAQNEGAQYFYQRCMQFSGPLMAKGFEDTLMYSFNNFIAHNEVGDSPAATGYSVPEFHGKMKQRQRLWPLSINTTATHDTKRGEDVRSRLNVISDVADEWIASVSEWMVLTTGLKNEKLPDKNDQYFIFQTIVGHYPMPGENVDDFKNRLAEYLQKALRESKVHSNWAEPNEEYENAAKSFAFTILDENKPFRKRLQSFQNSIVDFGIINSLIQVLLKFTCPGVPDVYQGTDLWDLSFVDPDNRRPVDYERRSKYLEELKQAKSGKDFFSRLWQDRHTGKIKLWLTHHLYQLRKELLPVFTDGEYIPLEVKGKYKEYIIAFARRWEEDVLIIAAPLHLADICRQQKKDWQQLDWDNTRIILPPQILAKAKNLLTSETVSVTKELEAKYLFSALPYALFKGDIPANERGAGLLLHISSLPSSFGIGDLGPEAKAFADFLHRSHQKYWQLLPLNPTEQGQSHSPYSSTSSSAGNVLFISPELLAQNGFLETEDLEENHLPPADTINFEEAEAIKKTLLDKAWENFKKQKENTWQDAFEAFCKKEEAWLDDFVLYTVLKKQYGGKPWFEWPDEIKFRTKEALKNIKAQSSDEYLKYKWFQFLFAKQWNDLKKYCNSRRIKLIGDIPFYVSYDSADVWTNREIFKLDRNGNRIGVAGVPPDAFSDDGQLWGMPVFRWDVLKKKNYPWWTDRLKKNLELFDIVRLDHFRAFSAYWEVPSTETTAKTGKWKKGPGAHFFKYAKKVLGDLPFIAEDLGEIDDPVYELRDQFRFPGMKVLQFAFGDDMASSIHIPHNYEKNFFVYPGTHDNNTVLGWWKKEAEKDRVEEYVGQRINDDKIARLLCRVAHASVARVVILPTQDLLGLDEKARMNLPSSAKDNWHWRLMHGQLNDEAEKSLQAWTETYNRG